MNFRCFQNNSAGVLLEKWSFERQLINVSEALVVAILAFTYYVPSFGRNECNPISELKNTFVKERFF